MIGSCNTDKKGATLTTVRASCKNLHWISELNLRECVSDNRMILGQTLRHCFAFYQNQRSVANLKLRDSGSIITQYDCLGSLSALLHSPFPLRLPSERSSVFLSKTELGTVWVKAMDKESKNENKTEEKAEED